MSIAHQPASAGIGLKPEHVDAACAQAGSLDFVEVHAENYMVAGGPVLRRLERVREHWPLSLHGVGLSIGGAGPLDADHLARYAALARRFEPRWCSEHLAWSSHGGRWFNDLLPLPYTAATLRRVAAHVDQVQAVLGRRVLIENPSSYIEFAESTMDEGGFLAELVRRTGCGLLLDVNNAHVSAVNHGRDPWRLIEALPAAAIGEIHLAGHAHDHDGEGAPLLIDDHGDAVDAAVWVLYRRTIERLGPRPTLIERDHRVPAFEQLAAEAATARAIQQTARDAPFSPEGATLRGVVQ